MGLAWPPARRRGRDVPRWLAYATRDDYVQAEPLPYRIGDRRPEEVLAAVAGDARFAALDGPLPDFGAYRARQRRNARGPGLGWD